MTKILCLIDAISLGGAERQIIGLAHLLKKKGYMVDLAYYDNSHFYLDLVKNLGVNCVFIPSGENKLSKFLSVRRFIKVNRYETVIAYKSRPSMMICILKMLGFKLHVIVSERNVTQRLFLFERIKYRLFHFADNIVPNSYAQAKFIENNYPSLKNNVTVIPNFTDINYFCPSSKEVCKPLHILTVARIADQKNVINYLMAISEIRKLGVDVKVKWLGDVQPGEEEYGKLCYELWEQLELQDSFTFVSAQKDILAFYQDCDVFCLPSNYEGYPNAICEAMSCGKPILCSRVCDNPIIVSEGVNGFMFNPESTEDMLRVIKHFINLSQTEIKEMGEKSRELAINKFSEDVFVQKYISIIDSY